MPGKILVAKQSFSCEVGGEHYTVQGGVTRVREGHELALANPEAFEPIGVHYDVEDASASPGRKRGQPATVATGATPSDDDEPDA